MLQLKNVRVLTLATILAALAIVMGFFKLPISQILELRFASHVIAIAGSLLGPVVAMMVGVISDIGGFFIKPTGPFFPGFTISAALTGLIYGYFLYKKPFSLKRIIMAQVVYTIAISALLNTIWLATLYQLPFYETFIARLITSAIQLPIHIIILTLLLKGIERLNLFQYIIEK
ncbi:folate family ECF transporter S component [Streptococcus zalophi]|uniref:Folate family ECF transporter S component n=1 Tax=Streptococcus zalophi TaxID=640031 RepID=A0A934UDI6_9STRE|nr:folate family ECF transporter S component [Streptococcus zalophi]MBJ8349709.1 folate family ECF transporter S component [Streptococcus zalophi]MCR8967942.1 folate family ECF transporter S component [Streptococcus zalophi]